MSKFWGELLAGVAAIILGVWLSLTSRYVLLYGLIVAGLFLIVLAFVHLSQGKKRNDASGSPVKMFYPTNKPQEKTRFIQNLESQEDLDMPKQVSIACSRQDQASPVFLNGTKVGDIRLEAPLVFTVTKKNNVVNISEQYEGVCFFHVVNAAGTGALKVGIGMQSAAVKVVKNTGLADGLIEKADQSQCL